MKNPAALPGHPTRTEIVRTTVPGEYALHRALLAERQTAALPLDDEATRKIARELYQVIWNEAVDHVGNRVRNLDVAQRHDLNWTYQLRPIPEPEREAEPMTDQPEPEPQHDETDDEAPPQDNGWEERPGEGARPGEGH